MVISSLIMLVGTVYISGAYFPVRYLRSMFGRYGIGPIRYSGWTGCGWISCLILFALL